MANTNGPFGLRPVRKLGGGVITQNEYSIATAYGTKIHVGAVVALAATKAGRAIELAAANTAKPIGAFRGCSYVDANGSWTFAHYWPGVSDGKKDIVAYVIDDPDVIFECQATTIAAADMQQVAQILIGTGNDNTGISAAQWDGGNKATTGAGKCLRAIRLVNRPDNEYGAYAKIEVVFAEHVHMGVASAVAA